MTPRRISLVHWFLLALIVLAAACLRYQRIGWDALSFDEMWHLVLSTGRGSPHMTWPGNEVLANVPALTEIDNGAPAWWQVWTHMDRVLHPPLFVMTLRWWREAFGSGDAAAQWYIAAWSIASIVLTFDFVRTLTRGNATAGLWAAAILAVAPTQISLAQEVRSYTMLMGLTCGAFCVIARIETLGMTNRRITALAALMLAMMLTHYFAIGPCAAMAIWAALRLRGRDSRVAAVWFASAAVVYAIVWGPLMIRQIPDIVPTADPWLKEGSLASTLSRFISMPARLFVESPSPFPRALWQAIGGAVLIAAVARLSKDRALLLPLLWFAGVCGFLLVLDLSRATKHLAFIRYSLPAAPAVAAMIVMMCSRRVLHFVGGTAVAILLWQWPRAFDNVRMDYADFRIVRRFMVEHANPGEPMLFYSGPNAKGYFNEILLLSAGRERSLFPRDVVKLMRPAEPELIASLPGRTAWLFSGPIDDVAAVLPGCRVIEQTTLTDADGRFVALCARVATD